MQKQSKYRLYAGFLWLLKINYKKINRKSQLLNDEEEEYDRMIDTIVEGFNSGINIDSANDKLGINKFKLEYFLYGLSEMKFTLNEIELFLNHREKIEERLDFLINSRINKKEQIELDKLLTQTIKTIGNLKINLEIIFYELINNNISHIITQFEHYEMLVVPRNRYYIPLNLGTQYEYDINNPRYIQTKVITTPLAMNKNSVNHYLENIKNNNQALDKFYGSNEKNNGRRNSKSRSKSKRKTETLKVEANTKEQTLIVLQKNLLRNIGKKPDDDFILQKKKNINKQNALK
eukprot:CAMPEP_0170537366 /NCGR_PEP_ID=MMETSP0209-20121228/102671_1 /TAXON_ID=665100 ORGANISM="Litonotus pictus, Strain P1" /NCGR_SAMPLE_ID=MMETSP0209 /ASSEMBLY_ACC=CAM_ASM_000301 /LENGTH=290 /DNA_ID=CAMNT_0010838853 /DNA_START=5847 /DNA_END=6716 /DNA_ORIENTATION=-